MSEGESDQKLLFFFVEYVCIVVLGVEDVIVMTTPPIGHAPLAGKLARPPPPHLAYPLELVLVVVSVTSIFVDGLDITGQQELKLVHPVGGSLVGNIPPFANIVPMQRMLLQFVESGRVY